jgi:hypothetical protein
MSNFGSASPPRTASNSAKKIKINVFGARFAPNSSQICQQNVCVSRFLYGSQNSTNEPKFKEKLSEDDISDVKDAIKEGLAWLSSNTEASVEDIQAKQRDIESRVHPILAKAYQDDDSTDTGSNDAPTDEAAEDDDE